MLRSLLLASLFLTIGTARTQYKHDQSLLLADLEAVNAHFEGLVRFTIDNRDRLVADLYDGGEHYRQDMAYVEFLDPGTFAFSPEEKLVMLKCTAEKGRCIDKEIFKLKSISHTGRMGLPLPASDPDGSQALVLLGKLVRDKQMALRGSGGETDRRGTRRN